MPLHGVPSTLAPAASVADKKGIRATPIPLIWIVNLARAAAFLETPMEVRYFPQRGLCGEHFVPEQGLAL